MPRSHSPLFILPSLLVRPRPGDTGAHAQTHTQTHTDTQTHTAATDSGSLTGAEVSEPSVPIAWVGTTTQSGDTDPAPLGKKQPRYNMTSANSNQ